MFFIRSVGVRNATVLIVFSALFASGETFAGSLDGMKKIFHAPQGGPACAEPTGEILKNLAANRNVKLPTATDIASTGPGGGSPPLGNSAFRKMVTPLNFDKNTPPFALHRESELEKLALGLAQNASVAPEKSFKITVLVGDDGVGRTSLVMEMARKNPDRVIALNLSADKPEVVLKELEGSMDNKGKHVPGLLETALAEGKVLFIDDLSFLLKPEDSNIVDVQRDKIRALIFSGQVPIIMEATPGRYLQLETQLRELAQRRLFKVIVNQLQDKELFEATRSAASRIENFYKVSFNDDALSSAIEAGKRFNFGKDPIAMPGAAIELMQRVAIYLRHSSSEKGVLQIDGATFARLLDSISDGGYKQIDKIVLQDLEKNVLAEVKDQDEAVHEFLKGIRTALRQSVNGKRWRIENQIGVGSASALMGPSGVGKTFTPKMVKKVLKLPDSNFIMYEQADFFQEHAIAIIKGSPKGYKGMGTGGEFVNKLRAARGPVWVVCDEFEKWPKQVRDAFLTMLQEGKVTDFDGNTAYLSEVHFVFPMNTADKEIMAMMQAGMSYEQINAAVSDIVKRDLGGPFAGRVRMIFYKPISKKGAGEILDKVLASLGNTAKDFGIHQPIEITSSARDEILQIIDPTLGGRNVVSTVVQVLSDELSDLHLLRRPPADLLAEQKVLTGDYGLDERVDDLVKIQILFKDGHFIYQAELKDGTAIRRTLKSPRIVPPEPPAVPEPVADPGSGI